LDTIQRQFSDSVQRQSYVRTGNPRQRVKTDETFKFEQIAQVNIKQKNNLSKNSCKTFKKLKKIKIFIKFSKITKKFN